MELSSLDLLKIILAIIAGGLIGIEREYRDKAAGFRTLIFISVGAALFTMLSLKLAGDRDPTRIAASIVTGVGFLGAGVILRNEGKVIGLTTAATIWLTAALGMGIGGGQIALASAVTLLMLVVLWVFPFLERWIDNIREERLYEITCKYKPEKIIQLEQVFQNNGLKVNTHSLTKSGLNIICHWTAKGRPRSHQLLVEQLLADREISELRY